MKSIIGYYYPPLTQEERDIIYGHFLPIYNKDLTDGLMAHVNSIAGKIVKEHSGYSFNHRAFLAELNEKLSNQLKELLVTRYGWVSQVKDLKAEFIWDGAESLVLKYDGILKSIDSEGLVLSHPGPYHEDILVNNYNRYLSQRPSKRILTSDKRAYKIDKVNSQIRDKLRSYGYQSETNADIYDFSDIIAPLIK